VKAARRVRREAARKRPGFTQHKHGTSPGGPPYSFMSLYVAIYLHKHRRIALAVATLSAYLHRRGDRKWFRGGPVYGSGRASVCSLALIAAGSCERAAGSGGAERPRSGAAGALDAAAREQIMGCGGKGANRGSAVSGLAWGLSCWGPE